MDECSTSSCCSSPVMYRHKSRLKPLSMNIQSLPDDVLVRIGVTVATLSGAKDFVHLSHTSKRFYGLLRDSEETLHKILRIRSNWIHRSLPLPHLAMAFAKTPKAQMASASKNCKAPKPPSELIVQSLEQLVQYERLSHLELQTEHSILGIVGCSNNNSSNNVEIYEPFDLHRCLVAVAKQIPTVVLGDDVLPRTNATTTTATEIHPYMQKTKHYLHHDSYFCWQSVYQVLLEHLRRKRDRNPTCVDWISCYSSNNGDGDRFWIRSWRATSNGDKSMPKTLARRGVGTTKWVEVFFNMTTNDASNDCHGGLTNSTSIRKKEDSLDPDFQPKELLSVPSMRANQ